MGSSLSREEQLRYSRHLILPEVGLEGQQKLKAARVLLVGAGGLGSPAALYLAASGVGTLGLVDFDNVDLTNLHRQIIHGTSDVGRSKLESAAEAIYEVNPNVQVIRHPTRLSSENALEIIADYDLVLDGTDNFPTRYLVNDACVLLGKQNMYGSIFRFEGQATVFGAPGGPCYRCLYPEPPPPGEVPSCAESGVLGVLPGIIGVIQATEAIKAILGVGEPLVGRLMLYDALAMEFRTLKIRRDPGCPICGDSPTIEQLIDYDQFCGLPGKVPSQMDLEITAAELLAMIRRGDAFELIDVREPYEHVAANIPNSTLIPLAQVPAHALQFRNDITTVIYCHSGMRSMRAVEYLRAKGFDKMLNLQGGILEWMKLPEA